MPRLIDTGRVAPIDFAEFSETLAASRIDAEDEVALATLAPLLAALGANPDFLAEAAAIAALERQTVAHAGPGYGPQVLMLESPDPNLVLRANFWPATGDAVTRASGAAAFAYGLTHNHNFAFLTHGYLGPGYESDFWTFDPDCGASEPGGRAHLRFAGRYRLSPGTTMLYRAHRNVHRQEPPTHFSVSLNILARPARGTWQPQYRFDPAADVIADQMAVMPSKALLALAVHASSAGRAMAMAFARGHRCARMRATALNACVDARLEGTIALAEGAAGSSDRELAGRARALLHRPEADPLAPVPDGSRR